MGSCHPAPRTKHGKALHSGHFPAGFTVCVYVSVAYFRAGGIVEEVAVISMVGHSIAGILES